MKNDLKNLSNPKKYKNPISVKNQNNKVLQKMLRSMLIN